MSTLIRAEILYPESRLFLDYISERNPAASLFEHPMSAYTEAAEARTSIETPRKDLSDALLAYNARISASHTAVANIEAIQRPDTLCVLTGQQAGFLGGPAYTVYKALHAIRLAAHLQRRLERRVVPIFWLASEDHDFTEINRVRLLRGSDLRTVSFEWAESGRPIESLPLLPEILEAAHLVLDQFPDSHKMERSLFLPEPEDDYALWHARILSRLFEAQGLILVEPRAIRHLSGGFMGRALALAPQISDLLREACEQVREAGYDAELDPQRAGRPFVFSEDGYRRRWDPGLETPTPENSPDSYSPDAALRPLLADTLFPTIASILGPGEIAYQALLNPLYHLFDLPQPIIVPRHGYTVLGRSESALLTRLGVGGNEALLAGFDPWKEAQSCIPLELRSAFSEAREGAQQAMDPLLPRVTELDPGLDARWRQATDHAKQAVDRLEERAASVALARQGLSRGSLRSLAATLRPSGRLQERVLSFVHLANRFGVEWLSKLDEESDPERFEHRILDLQGD